MGLLSIILRLFAFIILSHCLVLCLYGPGACQGHVRGMSRACQEHVGADGCFPSLLLGKFLRRSSRPLISR